MADTIVYVSNTASNGYAVGADSGTGATKAAPFLTPEHAFEYVDGVAGDHRIIINSGVYSGTGLGTNQYFLFTNSPVATSVAFEAEEDGKVSFISTVSTAIMRMNSSTGWGGKSLSITGIVFGRKNDSEVGVDPNYAFWQGSANMASELSVSFVNCDFYNPVFYGVHDSAASNATYSFTDCGYYTTHSTSSRGLFYTTSLAAGGLSVDGLTVSVSKFDTSGHGIINFDAAAANMSSSIKNVTGTLRINPASTASDSVAYGIRITNVDNSLINNVTLTMIKNAPGATWGVYAINSYCNDALLTASNQDISNCTVNLQGWDSTSGAGFGIALGGDIGDLQANLTTGRISECTLIGDSTSAANNLHGIGIVSQTDCQIDGCIVAYADIGVLLKLTTTSVVSGCLTYKCGGGSSNVCYYNKGGTNDDFFSNHAIIDSDSDSIAFLAGVDGVTNTTGSEFKGNYIAVLADTTQKVILVNTSQTATFDYNHFTIIGSLPSNPFTYQATNYASAAAWIAARETNGVDLGTTNPMEDSDNGNYAPLETSALIGAGTAYWSNANPTSYSGEPLNPTSPDIGGYQTTYSSYHPSNL